MLDYLRLDGVDLLDYSSGAGHRDVSRIEGLIGLAGVRGASTDKTEQHGSVNRGRYMRSKTLTIEGAAWGTTVEDAHDQYVIVEQAVYETLIQSGGGLLTWGIGDLDLQAYIKLTGELSAPLEDGAAELVWQAQFEQMDPRAYSQALTAVVGTDLVIGGGGLMFPFVFPFMFVESAGGLATVTNTGTLETPPVVRIYGPVTSPRYVLDSSEVGVKISGEVGVGDFLEIDHAKRTVKLNGLSSRMNLLDTVNSTFFDIPTGAHDITLIASSFGAGAHLEVDVRAAHGG